MFGLPIWLWVILVVAAVVVIWLQRFQSRYRAMCRTVRDELVQVLKDKYPEIEVAWSQQGNLMVQSKTTGARMLDMADVYVAVGRLPGMGRDPEARARVYQSYAQALSPPALNTIRPLSLTTHGDQIRPQLVKPEFLRQFSADAGLLHTSLPGLGLETVYVLDLPQGRPYLAEQDRIDLGLDAARVHRRALDNLRKDFPAQMIAEPVARESASAVQFGDTFDAARLLVIPEFLQAGQELVALIPHRDVLLLLPATIAKDQNKMRQGMQVLQECKDHQPLLDRPVRVTQNGIEAI